MIFGIFKKISDICKNKVYEKNNTFVLNAIYVWIHQSQI